jgi:predicted transcriptional regulator
LKKTVDELLFGSLSENDKSVFYVLVGESDTPFCISKISRICKLTDCEVIGAIQNLIHKKMYPIEKILYEGGDYLFTTIKPVIS